MKDKWGKLFALQRQDGSHCSQSVFELTANGLKCLVCEEAAKNGVIKPNIWSRGEYKGEKSKRGRLLVKLWSLKRQMPSTQVHRTLRITKTYCLY